MLEPITFLATIAPIQSAIQAGGDGMRLKLDIAETQMGAALHLLMVKDQILKVTVEILPPKVIGSTPNEPAKKRKA